MKRLLALFFLSIRPFALIAQEGTAAPFAHTYSIVAHDAQTGEMAVGVQSHWFSVGTLVSWGKSGVGVVATQSLVNPAFGPEGLALMEQGLSASEALAALVEKDEGKAYRQVAFLDHQGRVAAHTGEKCIQFAGHAIGDGFSVQANMMLTDQVVQAMKKAFEIHPNLPLAERIIKVMEAAESVGGDIRGKQSAALLVVGPEKTSEAWTDKQIDLRVDDHSSPVQELKRLLQVHRAYAFMNAGDVAMEKGDMSAALQAYDQAQALQPENIEMVFWKAVTLLNNKRNEEAAPLFERVFAQDVNYLKLLRRLPQAELLSLSETELDIFVSVLSP